MLVINYKNDIPQQRFYALGVRGNNKSNKIKFVVAKQQADVELGSFACNLKVENKEHGYKDLIILNGSYKEKTDTLEFVWEMTEKSTQFRTLELQLEFLGEGEVVWQTLIAELELNDTIKVGDEKPTDKELSALKQLEVEVNEHEQEITEIQEELDDCRNIVIANPYYYRNEKGLKKIVRKDENDSVRKSYLIDKIHHDSTLAECFAETDENDVQLDYENIDNILNVAKMSSVFNQYDYSQLDCLYTLYYNQDGIITKGVRFGENDFSSYGVFSIVDIPLHTKVRVVVGKYYEYDENGNKVFDEHSAFYCSNVVGEEGVSCREITEERQVFELDSGDSTSIYFDGDGDNLGYGNTRFIFYGFESGEPAYDEYKERDISKYVETTYKELKWWRDNDLLERGTFYRITDYQCITTQDQTQSAGHQFDIIVQALSENQLSETAYAIQSLDDHYFDDCDLKAWELKYCLDNDKNRFAWADETNGKGVIYYMKDEWNNECPYDFKNIQFSRIIRNGEISSSGSLMYFYTFSFLKDDSTTILDTSIYGNNGTLLDDAYEISGVSNNEIKKYCAIFTDQTKKVQFLNNIVFFATYFHEEWAFYGYRNNIFDNDCRDMTLKDGAVGNSFGIGCSKNTCEYGFDDNIIGNDCSSLKFGNDCVMNVLKYSCKRTTFEENFAYNTIGSCDECSFGENCSKNVIGFNFNHNTIGKTFTQNIIGNDCNNITFGGLCSHNIIGNNCPSNTFDNTCIGNVLEDNCAFNNFGRMFRQNILKHNCQHIVCGQGGRYNVFGSYCDYITLDSSCKNNVFGNQCKNNQLGSNCEKNTFGNDCENNELNGTCLENSFGNACHDNELGQSCRRNVFGDDCYSNTLAQTCMDNKFGDSCFNNTLGEACYYNIFVNHCYNNQLGNSTSNNKMGITCHDNILGVSCVSNTFGNGCYSNTLGNYCEKNEMKKGCYENTLNPSCCNNTFENESHNNTLGEGASKNSFGQGCYYTTLGEGCYNNILQNNCGYNSFGTNCRGNTLGSTCEYNNFGNNFINNSLGNECANNTFGNNCQENTFGNACQSNNFGNTCQANVMGDNFYGNTIGDIFKYNYFGDGCMYNTFGMVCSNLIFQGQNTFSKIGQRCNNITLGKQTNYVILGSLVSDEIVLLNDCKNIIIENACSYLYFEASGGSGDYKNIHVHLGVQGASSTNPTTLSVDRGNTFETSFKPINSVEVNV